MGGHHSAEFLTLTAGIATAIDHDAVERLALALAELRDKAGRLFVLGLGGSAANASHAVNDLRKLCRIEAYTPVDNVAELTARANDEGWATIFSGWLRGSDLCSTDAVLILSVGGGDKGVSTPLIEAIDLAQERGAAVYAIVGRTTGHAGQHAGISILVPPYGVGCPPRLLTPLHEAFQGVILHCLVSHPSLQIAKTKW